MNLRFVKGRIVLLGLSALFVLVVLSFLKDIILKTVVEAASPQIIGAKMTMGRFSLGLLSHKIHIENFRMYNPPGFPDEVFLVMPEVTVDADIGELIKGRMHFPSVVFNMDKVVVVRNKEGKLNVDSLKIVQEQMAASKGKPAKLPVFKIDTLQLNIGRIVVKDSTHAPPVLVQVYDVGIKNKTIKNIDSVPKLAAVVLVEALKPTAIRSAGMMAATTLLGVGFFPAVAIGVAVAQDDVKADLNHPFQKVYQECLAMIKDLGELKKADPHGQILAKIYGCDVTIQIQDKGLWKSSIQIKVRKHMLAKLEIAAGLLYQLNERL